MRRLKSIKINDRKYSYDEIMTIGNKVNSFLTSVLRKDDYCCDSLLVERIDNDQCIDNCMC